MKNKKKVNIFVKILLIILISIVSLLVLVWGGYFFGTRIMFNEYYSIMEELNVNPGLNDGYVVQGTSYIADKDVYITSGYMQKKQASRVYSVDKDKKVHYCEILNEDGSMNLSHFGGVTTVGNYVYIASSNALSVCKLDDILNKDQAKIMYNLKVNNQASFVFANNKKENMNGLINSTADIYVGEFNNDNAYVTKHPYTNTDGKETKAIVSKYSLVETLGVPTLTLKEEYSILNEVQGFCVTDTGKFVLSTSWAINPSHFYVYNLPNNAKADAHDGLVPVYHLDSRYLEKDIVGPAMAEDLDYYDGKVIYCSEAASNKYIFGKLFFYNSIYGLKIS